MIINRHGLNWEVEGAPATSTYVNGDICVPAGTKVIRVTSDNGNTTVSQINPAPLGRPGSPARNAFLPPSLKSDMSYHYDASLETKFPFVLQDGMSLVSAVQAPGAGVPISHCAVLTAVAVLPAPGTEFRPAYTGPLKPAKKRVMDMRNPGPVIPNHPYPFDINQINKVWPDFVADWPGQYIHASNNMKAYGRDIASIVGDAALAVCFTTDEAARREIIINLCQIGIDMYGLYMNGQYWTDGGGHSHGRKLPIIFAGLVFNDPSMMLLQKRFGEDHAFFVQKTGTTINNGFGGYGNEHIGMAEWGWKHADIPNTDNIAWDSNVTPYRFCCTANSWLGQCIAMRLMGGLKAWNNNAWATYLDKYIRKCKADGSPGWWLDWSDGRQLAAWDKFRVQDAPATQSIGYGTHFLMSDIPPLVGQPCTIRIRGPYHPNCKVILALGRTRLIPTESPPIPVPGIIYKGFTYLDSIDVSVTIDHTSNQTTYNVPLLPHNLPGTGFTLQAFILNENGVWTSSNALELIVQDPTKPPVLG